MVVESGENVDVTTVVRKTTVISTGLLGLVRPEASATVVPRGESHEPDLTIQRVEPAGTTPKPNVTKPVELDVSVAITTQLIGARLASAVVVRAVVWPLEGATIRSSDAPAIPESVLGS